MAWSEVKWETRTTIRSATVESGEGIINSIYGDMKGQTDLEEMGLDKTRGY